MRKILVVDDEPDTVRSLKENLEKDKLQVLTSYDGEEALAILNEETPDLIILDIVMPKMDGFTFIREIKAKKELKDIPVIILSAKDKMRDLFEMEGIEEYFIKPYEIKDLIAKIKSLLKLD